MITLSALGPLPPIAERQLPNTPIIVRSRIQTEDLLAAIQWCIAYLTDGKSFVSEPLYQIITDFALIRFYTNIDTSFLDATPMELHDIYENYDLIVAHNIMPPIRAAIDPEQLQFFEHTLRGTLTSIIAYKNSAVGIIDLLASQADTNTKALEKALTSLENDEQLTHVRQLLEVFGQQQTAAGTFTKNGG